MLVSTRDYVEMLETQYSTTYKKEERNAIALLLEGAYKKIMSNPQNSDIMIKHSKINGQDDPSNPMLIEYDYITSVIESCETAKQIESARRMIENFCDKYGDLTRKKKIAHPINIATARSCFNSRIEKVRIQKEIKL